MRILILAFATILLIGITVEWTARLNTSDRLADLDVFETPQGQVVWSETGEGPSMLVIHGAGGGADQGLLLASGFVGDGVGNEGAALAGDYLLERIKAPTFFVHARDDGINPFGVGAEIASRIPGARLIAFDSGGHLLLGHARDLREITAPILVPRKEN